MIIKSMSTWNRQICQTRCNILKASCEQANFVILAFPMKAKYRSRHRRCSLKKGVLRNFEKFTGKHLCQRLFLNKVEGLRPATLLKKSLWHKYFPVNFAKFLRTPFLQSTSGRMLLKEDFSYTIWVIPNYRKNCYRY